MKGLLGIALVFALALTSLSGVYAQGAHKAAQKKGKAVQVAKKTEKKLVIGKGAVSQNKALRSNAVKPYINNKYGFEFRIPFLLTKWKGYIVRETKDDLDIWFDFLAPGVGAGKGNMLSFLSIGLLDKKNHTLKSGYVTVGPTPYFRPIAQNEKYFFVISYPSDGAGIPKGRYKKDNPPEKWFRLIPSQEDRLQKKKSSKTSALRSVSQDKQAVNPLQSAGAIKPQAALEQAPTQAIVILTDSGFSPATITVKVGEKVKFINQSSGEMRVASAVHPSHQLYPEFVQLSTGNEFTFAFIKAGSWKYHNHINANKFGTVIVK